MHIVDQPSIRLLKRNDIKSSRFFWITWFLEGILARHDGKETKQMLTIVSD
jgi:hypothetical protein